MQLVFGCCSCIVIVNISIIVKQIIQTLSSSVICTFVLVCDMFFYLLIATA